MKREIVLLTFLLLFVQWAVLGDVIAGTAHTAYGKVFNSDSSVPADGDITFISYIVSRPDEILTESSGGCSYSDEYWQVQVGNFPSDWSAGDVLRTEVTNTVNEEVGTVEVVMTNNGSDEADDLHLGPVPVELSSFAVFSQNGSVVLEWSTESETNNFGFEIQRKQEGANFNKIGFVPGHGTTTTSNHYSYKDADLSGGFYYYRLKQMDHNGSFEFSDVKSVELAAPSDYALEQNFPNPFNSETIIRYKINQAAENLEVKLLIYNSLGELVRTLVDERQSNGNYSVVWDGQDNSGNMVSSGIYIGRLITKNAISNLKMIYMKQHQLQIESGYTR